MGLIKNVGLGFEYTGKILQTADIDEFIEEAAKDFFDKIVEKQTSIFGQRGKKYKAKKIVRKQLENLANSDTLKVAIEEELKVYPDLIGEIAEEVKMSIFATGNIYIVPKFVLKAKSMAQIYERLGDSNELQRIKGGSELKDFYLKELTNDLDDEFSKTHFSLEKPFSSIKKWIVTGLDEEYMWGSHFGHYYLEQKVAPKDGPSILLNYQKNTRDEKLEDLKISLARLSIQENEAFTKAWELWLAGKRDKPPEFSSERRSHV